MWLGLSMRTKQTWIMSFVTHEARQQRFSIPAASGESSGRSHITVPLPADLKLLALMPHMHLRGKSFRYEARYPDGREEVLLDVSPL